MTLSRICGDASKATIHQQKKSDAEITPIQPAFPEVNMQITCAFPVQSINFHLQYVSFRTTMCTINVHTIGQKLLLVSLGNVSYTICKWTATFKQDDWSWTSSKFRSRRFTLNGFKFEGQNTFAQSASASSASCRCFIHFTETSTSQHIIQLILGTGLLTYHPTCNGSYMILR